MENKKLYINHLQDIKSSIFKILPLCEEKNTHIDSYISGIIHELKGFPRTHEELFNDDSTSWYVKVMSNLYAFHEDYTVSELHSNDGIERVRSIVFTLLSLIDKEIRWCE